MTMLETYSIKQAFKDGFDRRISNTVYSFGGTATMRDGTTAPVSMTLNGRDVLHEFSRYSTFGIVYDPDIADAVFANDPEGIDVFLHKWSDHITNNHENYNRIIGAYLSEYDPIANYSSRETHVYGETKDTTKIEVDERGKKETYIAPQATLVGNGAAAEFYADQLSATGETITETGSDDGKAYTHTFDDNDTDDHLVEHTVETPNTTTTTTRPQSAAFEYHTDPQTTTTVDGDEHTDRINRDGNIGVMTTQEMIEREIEMRKLNFLRKVVGDFITDNCITVRECD